MEPIEEMKARHKRERKALVDKHRRERAGATFVDMKIKSETRQYKFLALKDTARFNKGDTIYLRNVNDFARRMEAVAILPKKTNPNLRDTNLRPVLVKKLSAIGINTVSQVASSYNDNFAILKHRGIGITGDDISSLFRECGWARYASDKDYPFPREA